MSEISVNISVAVGQVVAVVPGERADQLIIADNSNPTYPVKVACEFYGEKYKALLHGIAPGEVVTVQGNTRSREHNGRWFTTFNALRLTRLNSGGKWGKEQNPESIPF